jgi:glycosyltransferase involved in cell wall biosynthesis
MEEKNIRIGIDCRLAGPRHAGIGRYSKNLVLELLKIENPQITWVLFFYDKKQITEVLGSKKKRKNLELVCTNIKHYGLEEQTKLSKVFKEANLDLLHVPHFNIPVTYKGKLIITIHDLLWHEQKGKDVTTLGPVKKAKTILVPTKTIKNTVINYYPFAENKIIVTKEGIADSYRQELTKKTDFKKKIKKQIVYTGSLYPHKNLKLVIRSLRKLPKYKLIVVGSRDVFQDRTKEMVSRFKAKKQVEFKGYLEDQKLISLYQESMALVQPSLSEGFGLTGIEAMAAKTAVLASKIKVFKEIYHNAAIFFDPKSSKSFVKAVKDLEFAKRKDIIEKGIAVAKQYSWQEMAEKTYQEYLKII